MRPSLLASVKTVFYHAAQNFSPWPPDEALGRSADQHDTGIAREQHQSVLQRPHDLIEVFFQCAEDFFHVANLAAESIDLGIDQAVLVGSARIRLGRGVGYSSRHLVKTAANRFQGPERNVRDDRGKRERYQNRDNREDNRAPQLRLNFVLQQDGRNADPNVAERLPVPLNRRYTS